MRIAGLASALLATTWVVLLATAPSIAFGVPLSGAVYAVGSLVCHQRPERSFHIGLAQVPVCARCYGVYLGVAIGALAALKGCATPGQMGISPAGPRRQQLRQMWVAPSGLTREQLRLAIVSAAIPTAVTWASEVAGLWQPANVTRFIAALPLGAALAVTVNYVECARLPRTGSRPPRIPI